MNSIAKSPIENRSRAATEPARCTWPWGTPRGSPYRTARNAALRSFGGPEIPFRVRRSSSSPFLHAKTQYGRRQSILVIYISIRWLNRTIRSPYRRRTPPIHGQGVSGGVCAQNQATNLLLLLLLFLFLRCGRGATSTAPAGRSTAPSSSTGGDLEKQRSASDPKAPTPIKRTEASFEEPSAINCAMQTVLISTGRFGVGNEATDSINVLALQLGDQLVQPLVIGLNTNSRENLLDVSGGGRSVSSNLEEQVGSNMAHLLSSLDWSPVGFSCSSRDSL